MGGKAQDRHATVALHYLRVKLPHNGGGGRDAATGHFHGGQAACAGWGSRPCNHTAQARRLTRWERRRQRSLGSAAADTAVRPPHKTRQARRQRPPQSPAQQSRQTGGLTPRKGHPHSHTTTPQQTRRYMRRQRCRRCHAAPPTGTWGRRARCRCGRVATASNGVDTAGAAPESRATPPTVRWTGRAGVRSARAHRHGNVGVGRRGQLAGRAWGAARGVPTKCWGSPAVCAVLPSAYTRCCLMRPPLLNSQLARSAPATLSGRLLIGCPRQGHARKAAETHRIAAHARL